MSATELRDHIRAMLADLRLPGALEAVDQILSEVDHGALHASQAIEQLLSAQITLRNNHRLRTAMRSSRLPAMGLSDFLCVEPYTTARQGEEQVWPRTIHRFSPKIC